MPQRILIVEDEESILTLLRQQLEAAGFEVRGHPSGYGMPEKVRETEPDLVLMDIMLPGDDGYNIIRRMSEDSALSGIPVVVLSALKESRPLFGKFRQVKDFLVKPVDSSTLLRTVRTALAPT